MRAAAMYLRIVVTLAVVGMAALWISVRRLQSSTRAAPAELRLPTEFEARLDARIGRVRLAGTFEQAIETLRAASGANIVVRWDGLFQEAARHPVKVHLQDVSLGEALRALLDQLPDRRLGFSAENGLLVIDDETRLIGITRYYNVRDLVETAWPPPSDPPPATQSGGLFGDGPYADERIEELAGLIDKVMDDGWHDSGGRVTDTREISGVFIITATWEHHRRIAWLLNSLRSAASAGAGWASPPTTPDAQRRGLEYLQPTPDGQQRVELRVYDVRRLLANIQRSDEQLRTQFFRADAAPDDETVAITYQSSVRFVPTLEDALVRFLKANVMPETWLAAGGWVGKVQTWSGRLLVHQTPDAHFEIETILKTLDDEFGKQ